MPLYDYLCSACDEVEEVAHPVSGCEELHPCGRCGGPRVRIIAPVSTVGPMPSRPLVLSSADLSFDRAEDARRYERDHPLVSRNDGWWQRHRDKAREDAETLARRQGYRDLDHKRESDRRKG